jgi:hypothetical protein
VGRRWRWMGREGMGVKDDVGMEMEVVNAPSL